MLFSALDNCFQNAIPLKSIYCELSRQFNLIIYRLLNVIITDGFHLSFYSAKEDELDTEEAESKVTKNPLNITQLAGAEEAPFSSTDTDNTSNTPSLGTERSALKDNVYATLNNSMLDKQGSEYIAAVVNGGAGNNKTVSISITGTVLDGYDTVRPASKTAKQVSQRL